MFWDKWLKKGDKQKQSRPKEMVDAVGMHLVTRMKLDPDWVWSLYCATRPRTDGKKSFDVRVFSKIQAQAKGVKITDYESLDAHPELILFEGRYDRSVMRAVLEDRRLLKAS